MQCKMCKREFDAATTKCGEKHLCTDGKYHADCSWSANYTCPHCGHDNSPQVKMELR